MNGIRLIHNQIVRTNLYQSNRPIINLFNRLIHYNNSNSNIDNSNSTPAQSGSASGSGTESESESNHQHSESETNCPLYKPNTILSNPNERLSTAIQDYSNTTTDPIEELIIENTPQPLIPAVTPIVPAPGADLYVEPAFSSSEISAGSVPITPVPIPIPIPIPIPTESTAADTDTATADNVTAAHIELDYCSIELIEQDKLDRQTAMENDYPHSPSGLD